VWGDGELVCVGEKRRQTEGGEGVFVREERRGGKGKEGECVRLRLLERREKGKVRRESV
jgi:hypothetical protein